MGVSRVLSGVTGLRLACTAILLLILVGRPARAQQTTLTVTSNLSLPTPTIADYNAGYICIGSVTLNASKFGGGANQTEALYVRSAGPIATSTPAGFDKPISDIQYTTGVCAAASTWVSVPASTSTQQLIQTTKTNFSVTLNFRLLLVWSEDRGGATYAIPGLTFWVNR